MSNMADRLEKLTHGGESMDALLHKEVDDSKTVEQTTAEQLAEIDSWKKKGGD